MPVTKIQKFSNKAKEINMKYKYKKPINSNLKQNRKKSKLLI